MGKPSHAPSMALSNFVMQSRVDVKDSESRAAHLPNGQTEDEELR